MNSAVKPEPAEARIPLSEPDLRGAERDYLTRCVDTNWISTAGSFVGDLEKAVAEYVGAGHGTKHGVATVNGTCGLELALRLAGAGPGTAVLIPDWTFVATSNAVRHAGALPHLVDVTAESWTLDPASVAQAIAESDLPVAAIVPVHALGHPADLDALAAVAQAHGIPIVEDGAGAIGAAYKDSRVGGHAASFAALFSFNGNKLMTAGSGGMIVTGDAEMAARARMLSAQARQGDAYKYEEIAFNYRMSNLSAAIGLAQFERLEEMLAARRAIARRYRVCLAGSTRLTFMPEADWATHNGWMSVLRCTDAETADGLIAAMDAAGIDARAFWEPLSAQPFAAELPRTLSGVSQAFDGTTVALPSSSSLSEADQDRVLAVLDGWR